jgi:hypothetical protein
MRQFLLGAVLGLLFLAFVGILLSDWPIGLRLIAAAGIVVMGWLMLREQVVAWLRGLLRDITEDDDRPQRRRSTATRRHRRPPRP